MPPPIENNAAQGHFQDLRHVDMGHHDMANDHPLHEHRKHAINNHAEVAQDIPAQGHAAPLAPVCTNLIFPGTCI